jgi:hypothetical protein
MPNNDRACYDDYVPVSLASAQPGWRAIYVHLEDEASGWSDHELIAWGVFEHWRKPCDGNYHDQPEMVGRVIHGVTGPRNGDYATTAEESANFWRYLAPGAPDPSPEEVAAELARQEQRDQARRQRADPARQPRLDLAKIGQHPRRRSSRHG